MISSDRINKRSRTVGRSGGRLINIEAEAAIFESDGEIATASFEERSRDAREKGVERVEKEENR